MRAVEILNYDVIRYEATKNIFADAKRFISVEKSFELRLNGAHFKEIFCSPNHVEDLAVGILLRVRLWANGYVKEGKLIQLEGASDCPVNFGGLCPKGLGYAQIPRDEEHRTTKPMYLYRAPGATEWQEISWDEAIERAARALKKARDEN